ncbi:hypothetical protein [Marivirga arenosa]|uniref:Uncharacterized protein n=1 Tax=Marivirga arenosa TaxID=3059076 RepID=A0AA49GEE3_9BACT|nr:MULTISPECIES: hypothetical protein [unclassified Marivirga]WKK80306.1 hypothetical protein QYS47_24545 [Marivirga sp. BKB1-2]WMN06609.1 hypothetical protein QYS48_33050 [Marivirga sp. ABR2-2]
MAQFIAFNKDVEVNKQTVLSIVNSMEKGKETRLGILIKNGVNPDQNEWFNQQNWLNAFKDIAENLGDMNLFLIGKAIINNAQFPPIKDLEEGLRSIDVAYHMNHRVNGKIMFDPETGKMTPGIGYYKVTKFDSKNKEAEMVCDNPYPTKFDEGIITQVANKFKPMGSRVSVDLDTTKEMRKEGANSDTFLIRW